MKSTEMSQVINLVLALLLVQSFFTSASADDDEYFRKAIFRALKEKNGQFSSEMQMIRYHSGHRWSSVLTNDQDEKFSFKTNTGLFTEYSWHYYSPTEVEHDLYVNGKEFYTYSEETKYCLARGYRYGFWQYLRLWAPEEVYYKPGKERYNYTIIGPNVLLELLYKNYDENKESVKCVDVKEEGAKNPKKCTLSLKGYRLDYNFVDGDEHTMIPTKIERYKQEMKKGKLTGEWKLRRELKYRKFTPIFAEEQIVTSDLPMQMGCKRVNPESYPKIEADYGTKFELELEVRANFTVLNGTEGYYYSPKTMNRTVRTYTVKMVVDKENSINVADTIDEITNASIRNYYDVEGGHLLHSVNLANNECSTYNLSSNWSLNWFYVQEMFVRRPELFQAKNYSYLSESSLDGVQCQVFEDKMYYYRDYWREYLKKATSRKSNNRVRPSGRVITTHFYPKDSSYWPDNPNKLNIPKRIEISVDTYSSWQFDHLTIDVKSFKSSPTIPEKYDTTKCKEMDKETDKKK